MTGIELNNDEIVELLEIQIDELRKQITDQRNYGTKITKELRYYKNLNLFFFVMWWLCASLAFLIGYSL